MAAKRLFSSPTFRFSIRQLLLGTALVAVACVALRSASPIWVAALLGLTLLALTTAVPLALFRQGTDRAYWFGFALFGWLYMLLLAYSWSLDPNTSQSNPLRPYSLVTARVSNLGYDKIYGGTGQSVAYQQVIQQVATTTATYSAAGPAVAYPTNPYSSAGNAQIPVTYFVPVASYTAVVAPSTGPALDDFVNVAHALWAILIAVCGGWFTCWLYATRPATTEEPPDSSAAPSATCA